MHPFFLFPLLAAAGAQTDVADVSLEILGRPEAPGEAAQLRTWLGARLAEEGYVLATPETAHLALRVQRTDAGWRLNAARQDTQSGNAERSPGVVVRFVSAGTPEVASLELLHQAVAALEQLNAPEVPAPSTESTNAETRASTPEPVTDPRLDKPSPRAKDAVHDPKANRAALIDEFWVLLGVGWQERYPAGDPYYRVQVGALAGSGLGLRSQFEHAPALRGFSGLVSEMTLQLGPTWHVRVLDHAGLAISALGGARWNVHTPVGGTSESSSTWLVSAPLEWWWTSQHFAVIAGGVVGTSGTSDVYTYRGLETWSRSASFWGANLSVGVAL